jgi:hypothetical protein
VVDTKRNRKCPGTSVARVHFDACVAYKVLEFLVHRGMGLGALIFDFDGVIGDSEAIANTVWRKL